MKKNFVYFILFLVLNSTSCTQEPGFSDPVKQPAEILKDMISFLTYQERNVDLSEDFTALDTNSEIITKESFLNLLCSGDYLPLRLISKDSLSYYQLYKLDASANKDIRLTLKSWGSRELALFKLEGSTFPDFNFVDLEGNVYTKETTKGKILVLKCWYIGCKACVKEMPELDDMVNLYKNRKDILFVSLAFDNKDALTEFLKKKTFIYSVVPDQEDFMRDVLNLHMYPTHFIVNKQGLITKVVNEGKALAAALKKEVVK